MIEKTVYNPTGSRQIIDPAVNPSQAMRIFLIFLYSIVRYNKKTLRIGLNMENGIII
jgi:hypothetical protein